MRRPPGVNSRSCQQSRRLGIALAMAFAPALAGSEAEIRAVEHALPAAPAGALTDAQGTDRASLRAEWAVARTLARLDEELDLGTFPDASPLWIARLAAAIEARDADAPGQQLLRRLAVELRTLGVEWALGGTPAEVLNHRPTAASPAGRERAERLARIRELVELVNRKLGLAGDEAAPTTPVRAAAPAPAGPPRRANRITRKYGSDACASAPSLSLGYEEGGTFGATIDGAASCGGPVASPDVWYVFTAPQTATYTFQTLDDVSYSPPFDTVLSLHAGCPLPGPDYQELACSDDAGATLLSSISHPLAAGESVWVRVSGYGGATGHYLLRVTLDRTIRGTVTREDDGTPIAGATVDVVDDFGYLVSAGTTGADGTYAVGVAAESPLYVRALDGRFIGEVYDDHPCPFPGSCYPYSGDPVPVSSSDASGIDFALEPGGTISGAITASATGEPPMNSTVLYLYDSAGGFLGSQYLASGVGSYEVSSLPPGTYYLEASSYGLATEVWSDVPCPGACDPTSGTPIVIGAGTQVTGVDFSLDRLGEIRGVVTSDGSATPAGSELVLVYDGAGGFAGSGYTASDGSYQIGGLYQGDHYVRTETSSYFDELYDDLPCEPDCDATSGTAIPVPANGTASGIDFALVPRATIEGQVTDSDTGDPLEVYVYLYDASGEFLRYHSTYSPLGSFRFVGLEAGTYYLRAGHPGFDYWTTHESELYDDIPCQRDCAVTSGNPVVTTATSQIGGVDFALDRRGRITGTVTDALSGLPAAAAIEVFELDGTYLTEGQAVSDGTYEVTNLPAGSYRIGTDSYLHRDEMYDDVPCAVPCDRTSGAAVAVQAKLDTPGIDFALDRLGSISGSVRSAASGGHLDAYVHLLDSSGASVAWTDTFSGGFELPAVQPGTYYLRAQEDSYEGPFQDEVYPDVPCQPDCDATEGTPIVVALGTLLTGFDFRLSPCPVDSRAEVTGVILSTSFKALACDRVSAGDAVLVPGADVTFKSGRSIALGDGFRVEGGARFRAVIEPAWSDD